jgi:hypothetical protein
VLAAADSARATNEKGNRANDSCQGVMERCEGVHCMSALTRYRRKRLRCLGIVNLFHWLLRSVLLLGLELQQSCSGERSRPCLVSQRHGCARSTRFCALLRLCEALECQDAPTMSNSNNAWLSVVSPKLPASENQSFLRPTGGLAPCGNNYAQASELLHSNEELCKPCDCTTHQFFHSRCLNHT